MAKEKKVTKAPTADATPAPQSRPGEGWFERAYAYLPPVAFRGLGGIGLFMTAMGYMPRQDEPYASIVHVALMAGFLISVGAMTYGVVVGPPKSK